MTNSKEHPICPHCKKNNNRFDAIGRTGLINYAGNHTTMICRFCNKNFEVDIQVHISFLTRK